MCSISTKPVIFLMEITWRCFLLLKASGQVPVYYFILVVKSVLVLNTPIKLKMIVVSQLADSTPELAY